jgi:hypothetical protein
LASGCSSNRINLNKVSISVVSFGRSGPNFSSKRKARQIFAKMADSIASAIASFCGSEKLRIQLRTKFIHYGYLASANASENSVENLSVVRSE